MKQFFFATLATLALTACSSVDDSILEPQIPVVPEKDAEYVFDFNVNCSTGYESNTRAIKEGWETGDRIFVFFAQNSNSYLTMTYDGSAWSYDLTGDELNLAESGLVSAAYVPYLSAQQKPVKPIGSRDTYYYSDQQKIGTYILTSKNATYNVQGQKVSANLALSTFGYESQFYIEGIDDASILGCDAQLDGATCGFYASISETVYIGEARVDGPCMAHPLGSGYAFYFNIDPTIIPTFTLTYQGTEYTYTASKPLENGKAYKLPALGSGKWSIGATVAILDSERNRKFTNVIWEKGWEHARFLEFVVDANDSEMNKAKENGVQLSPNGYPDVYAYCVTSYMNTIKIVTQASKIKFGDSNLFNNLSGVETIKGLNYLDFSGRITSLFSACYSLESVDLSGFSFDNANSVTYMFSHCNSLKSVDLSSFAPRNLYDLSRMFYECPNLEELRFGKNFVINYRTQTEQMFYNVATNSSELHIVCTEEVKTALSNPATGLDTEKVVWHLLSDNVPAEWRNGERLVDSTNNFEFREATSVQIEVNASESQIAQASKANGVRVLSSDFSSAPIYAYLDSDKTLHVITSSVGITMPRNCSGFFVELINATSITGIENLDFSNTESMVDMFAACIHLTELWLGPNFTIPEDCSVTNIFAIVAQESSSCQIHCSSEVWSKFIDPQNFTGIDTSKISHVAY